LRQIIPILLAILLFSTPAHAQLKNENLLVAMPDGYKVGFQDKNARQQMTEMVPDSQSVKDWTDMVTVQIFFGMTDVTPDAHKQRLEKLWTENCKGAVQSDRAGQRARLSGDRVASISPAEQGDRQTRSHAAEGDCRQGLILRRAEDVSVPAG
jgi:hypothetical protein